MSNLVNIEESVKKLSEWDFYSNVVKNLEISKEVLSEDPNDFILNVNNLKFNRFVCLTGEEEKTDCQTSFRYKNRFSLCSKMDK